MCLPSYIFSRRNDESTVHWYVYKEVDDFSASAMLRSLRLPNPPWLPMPPPLQPPWLPPQRLRRLWSPPMPPPHPPPPPQPPMPPPPPPQPPMPPWKPPPPPMPPPQPPPNWRLLWRRADTDLTSSSVSASASACCDIACEAHPHRRHSSKLIFSPPAQIGCGTGSGYSSSGPAPSSSCRGSSSSSGSSSNSSSNNSSSNNSSSNSNSGSSSSGASCGSAACTDRPTRPDCACPSAAVRDRPRLSSVSLGKRPWTVWLVCFIRVTYLKDFEMTVKLWYNFHLVLLSYLFKEWKLIYLAFRLARSVVSATSRFSPLKLLENLPPPPPPPPHEHRFCRSFLAIRTSRKTFRQFIHNFVSFYYWTPCSIWLNMKQRNFWLLSTWSRRSVHRYEAVARFTCLC